MESSEERNKAAGEFGKQHGLAVGANLSKSLGIGSAASTFMKSAQSLPDTQMSPSSSMKNVASQSEKLGSSDASTPESSESLDQSSGMDMSTMMQS